MNRFKRKHVSVAGNILFFCLLIISFLLSLMYPLQSFSEQTDSSALQEALQNGTIIRLHIIANSDSEADQALKLKIRDQILFSFGHELCSASVRDADSLYQLLKDNCSYMESIAKNTALSEHVYDPITAEVGIMELPEKQYGDILLPKGKYRTLRITIGSGQGKNWWCILFPQLCLDFSEDQGEAFAVPFWDMKQIKENWLLLPQQPIGML